MCMINILIVDDQQFIRQGLHRRLEIEPDFNVVGEAQDGREGLELAKELKPDVVLMDLKMPDLDGIKATRLLKASGAKCRIIMLTIHDDLFTRRDAYNAGVDVFLFKQGVSHLLTAIRDCGGSESLQV